MQEYQVQLQHITPDPETKELKSEQIMPINRVADVITGKQSTGELTLPGSSENETLEISLRNIKKYLTNLNEIAQVFRSVSDEVTRDTVDLASSRAVKTVQDNLDTYAAANDQRSTDIEEELRNHRYELEDPIDYGTASGQYFGHVRLDDAFSSLSPLNAAADGIGASHRALYNAWSDLEARKADNDHASEVGTYGKATKDKYGHVRIHDSVDELVVDGGAGPDDPTGGYGITVSQRALYFANAALEGLIQQHRDDVDAERMHANQDPTVYGSGSSTLYGHVKLEDNFIAPDNTPNLDNNSAIRGVAASAYALQNAYKVLNGEQVAHTTVNGARVTSQATGSTFGHVVLTDDPSDQRNADAGVAASGKALSTLQNSVNTQYAALGKSVVDGKQAVANVINANNASGLHYDGNTAFATLAYGVGVVAGDNDKAGYNRGYTQGVTDADNRANGNSANYQSGYNAGWTAGQSAEVQYTLSSIGSHDYNRHHCCITLAYKKSEYPQLLPEGNLTDSSHFCSCGPIITKSFSGISYEFMLVSWHCPSVNWHGWSTMDSWNI